MVGLGDSSTTSCPNCGKDMPLVSWVGEKPACSRCDGRGTVGMDWDFSNGDEKCLHDTLDELTEDSNNVHMVACPCPKCTPRC